MVVKFNPPNLLRGKEDSKHFYFTSLMTAPDSEQRQLTSCFSGLRFIEARCSTSQVQGEDCFYEAESMGAIYGAQKSHYSANAKLRVNGVLRPVRSNKSSKLQEPVSGH